MRVLAITNMYPPHHYGGYELLCADVVGRFREAGHEVRVLTGDWRVSGVESDGSDPLVERALRLYWDDHEIVEPGPLGRLAIERHNQAALARTLDGFRPEVVSVWAMGCLSMSLLTAVADRGIPMVSVVCDDWLIYGPRVDAWHRALRRRPWLDRLAARVLGLPRAGTDIGALATHCFISETTERATLDASPYTIPDRTLVYSGFDARDFPAPAPSQASARPAFGWRLLHVGRLDPRKGVDVAVRALAHLPEAATLVLLGRGDDRYEAELRTLVDALGLTDRVTFDVAARAELAAYYVEADVFVFPPRWSEPLGIVPLEAMACGTPVVATGTGGSGEYLIDEVTCLRFPVDDDVALSARIRRLAEDEELRATLVANGTQVAAELTMDRWALLLEDWHRHVIDPVRAPRPERRTAIRELFR